jgi:NAD(P)-dependent dehydrogenase (short-subunit alcohol dehydrogenase family)
MLQSLQEKVVCVTGSARRVGRAILLEFAKLGAHVVIHHSNSDAEAQDTAEEAHTYGVKSLIVKADQSSSTDVARLFETIHAHYGRLDVLVNSASNYKKKPLLEITLEEWHEVLDINLTGPFLCTQYAARLIIDSGHGGSIINISDNYGLHPSKARPHHSISKAGLIMLTRTSALALGEHNIRVNCVVPGPVLRGQESESHWFDLAQKLPIKRTGTPEDIGRTCTFLATNDFITGAVIHVDGGEDLS